MAGVHSGGISYGAVSRFVMCCWGFLLTRKVTAVVVLLGGLRGAKGLHRSILGRRPTVVSIYI